MSPAIRRPAAVHFEIGRVTLHGFSAANQERFVRSLEDSLRDVGAGGDTEWPATGRRTVARLDGGVLHPGASPEQAAGLVAATLRASIPGHSPGGGRS